MGRLTSKRRRISFNLIQILNVFCQTLSCSYMRLHVCIFKCPSVSITKNLFVQWKVVYLDRCPFLLISRLIWHFELFSKAKLFIIYVKYFNQRFGEFGFRNFSLNNRYQKQKDRKSSPVEIQTW